MRQLNLDQLRTLVTIAELGSFAAAAHAAPGRAHGEPAHRGTRVAAGCAAAAAPAPAGGAHRHRRAAGRARPPAAGRRRWRARRGGAPGGGPGRAGQVRLGASTGALAWLLSQALETMGRDHPGIDVQVAVLTSQDTVARLQEGRLDVGLVALPQPAVPGVQVVPWRRDPVVAYVPRAWQPPRTITPAWLAARPLIVNDASTRLHRVTMDWFDAAAQRPQPRIELNYNDAIKSLVAAGYGAALLPQEGDATALDARVVAVPVTPRLWRPLAVAHRAGALEPATQRMLAALAASRQRRAA